MNARRKSIVFIVGAGASAEFGLPTGELLKQKIHNSFNFRLSGHRLDGGNDIIKDAFRDRAKNDQSKLLNYISEAIKLRDALSLALSIDNLLDAHANNTVFEECGKIAIAKSIFDAERTSTIWLNSKADKKFFNRSDINNTWLTEIFRLIVQDTQLEALADKLQRICFIIFNYDRCVEHFLYHSFQAYYSISAEESAGFVSRIQIIHPYGTIGALEWQDASGLMFGEEVHHKSLLNAALRLKTFTESIDPTLSQIDKIRDSICYADKLAFLGFAFHPQNIRLIKPPLAALSNRRFQQLVFASAYRISTSDSSIISNELRKDFGAYEVFMDDCKCHELFQNNRRGLSF